MLRSLGLYLTKNRHNAIWVAFVCAVLPFFLGLITNWISFVIVGLITLKKGIREGAWVLVWVALPAVVMCFLGNPSLLISVVVFRGVMICLLAYLLSRTASWAMVMQVAALLGIIGVCLLHAFIPDVAGWWMQQLQAYWEGLVQLFGAHSASLQAREVLYLAVQFASGICVAVLLSFDLLLLVLARGWESALFNPKGLAKELSQLRMGYAVSVLALFCIVVAFLGSPLARDILPIFLMLYAAAGLSLIHSKFAAKKDIRLPLLVGLYCFLALFLPYMLLALGAVGFIDSWLDFRGKPFLLRG